MDINVKPGYSLKQLSFYFLKLGATGFGGPVALVNYIHRDLVEKNKWFTEDDYKEGMALAQLSPGPLATQLGIYLGYLHYGLWGATVAGVTFVIPSFIMVVLIGLLYRLFGGLPWMQSVFYGIGASVIGIISLSCYKLTTKSIGPINYESIKKQIVLWLFFMVAAAVTFYTQTESVWMFIGAGIIYMQLKAPPAWVKQSILPTFLISFTGFWVYDNSELVNIALFFSKAGAFVFGSGLAIVPFLHGGVVNEYHWLNEQQFLDAVAVAMITPGPVVITVAFIRYLVAGFPGASVAALATFLPCYLLTVIPAPYFKKYAKNSSIKAFVDGITATVIGALAGSVILIATRSIIDWPSFCIAAVSLLGLLYVKRLQEPHIILIAAAVGLLLKSSII